MSLLPPMMTLEEISEKGSWYGRPIVNLHNGNGLYIELFEFRVFNMVAFTLYGKLRWCKAFGRGELYPFDILTVELTFI